MMLRIKGFNLTASKPICTDSSGDPAVCAGTEGVWATANIVTTLLGTSGTQYAIPYFATTGVMADSPLSYNGTFVKLLDKSLIFSDSDVNHGITDILATVDYAYIAPMSGTAGGLAIAGLSDTDAAAVWLFGVIGSATAGDSTPAITLSGGKKDGTNWQALQDAGTVLRIQNYTTDLIKVFGNGNTTFAGSIGLTGTKVPAGFFTDLTVANAIAGSVTGTASNVSGTPALPNGTTATTQAKSDDTTKLATTAFVQAQTNTATSAGIVDTGAGQASKVWKTDVNGVPGWRDDATGGSPSFDLVASGTNSTAAMVVDSGASINPQGTGVIKATNLVFGSEARGDLVARGASVWGRLAKGSSGAVLTMNATDPLWTDFLLSGTTAQTYTFPSTSKTLAASDGSNLAFGSDARGDIAYRGASAYGRLAKGTAGAVLTIGANDPAWTTFFFSGTGAATYTFPGATKTLAASDASNLAVGSDARGDVLIRGASAYGRLGVGTSGSILTNNGTDPAWTTFFLSGTGAATYTFPGATSTLQATTGTPAGFVIASQAQGDLLYASSATAWARLGQSNQYKFLTTNGAAANPSWSAYTMPASIATGGIMYGSGTNAVSQLTAGSAGKILRMGASIPAWSSLTIPDTAAAGSVLISQAGAADTISALTSTSGTFFLKNVDGTLSWATGVGTITGSTGSTDNVLLTANGTGGVTIQANPGAITASDTGDINLPTGGTYKINNVTVVSAGADGSYYTQFGNNTTYTTGGAGYYRMAFVAGVPKLDINGTLYSIPYATNSNNWTMAAAGTSGGLPYFSASNTLSSTAALAQYSVLTGGGAGNAPVALTVGTDNQVLLGHTGAASSFGSLPVAALPTVTASKGGTGVANNDLNTLTFAGGNYSMTFTLGGNTNLTFPASGTLQTTTGSLAANTIPSMAAGDLLFASSGSALGRVAAGATTEILVGGGAAVPVWTTATGTGAPVRAGSPTFTTKITTPLIDLGTGISITGGAGVVTFTDLAGTSEVLALDLRTANTAKLTTTSGVDTFDIGALKLVTTGTIQGGVVVNSDANGMSAAEMTAVGLRGTMFIATGAGTWILPVPAGGESLCLMSSGSAADLVLDTTDGSTIMLKGTELANAVGITNTAGKAAGDFVCVFGSASGKWMTAGIGGAWLSQ